jgi:hypothetical protein
MAALFCKEQEWERAASHERLCDSRDVHCGGLLAGAEAPGYPPFLPHPSPWRPHRWADGHLASTYLLLSLDRAAAGRATLCSQLSHMPLAGRCVCERHMYSSSSLITPIISVVIFNFLYSGAHLVRCAFVQYFGWQLCCC